MSVTIVSTLPKTTPAPATGDVASDDTGSDNIAAGQDFASLLLGQMALMVPDILPPTTVQSDLPEADATPTDAASAFAALGIVPLEPGRATNVAQVDTTQVSGLSLSDIGKGDKTTSVSWTAPNTTRAPDAEQSGLRANVKTETGKTEPISSAITAVDDQPAKFAVATPVGPVAPGVEAVIVKGVSPETTATNVSALPVIPSNIQPEHQVSAAVPTSIRDQSWAGDFSQKVVWLATTDRQSAQLTLNPPHMGTIEISLNLDKGNASASFVSANAEVRNAIETALPRLREMFASAGIALGQTNVSAESFRQPAGGGEGNRSASQWMTDNAILGADSVGSLPARIFAAHQGNGLVDIFA